MRKTLLMLGMFYSVTFIGQVGINTTDPKVTLDVVGKVNDGTRPEGFIAPRLTGDALFAASGTNQYGTEQNGTIVYVTAPASSGNDIGQTINVTSPSYYYFDALANVWKKIGDDSNIFTSNGTLTDPRVMDMNNNTFGMINGKLSVGSNTPHPSSILQIESNDRGFLPPRMTRSQMEAIANPSLALMVYCTDCFAGSAGCLMINDSIDETSPKWGSLCSSNATTPNVIDLKCASSKTFGTLYNGHEANGVTTTVPYDGGNGGLYNAANYRSTGVAGLTAHLPTGVLNDGEGDLVFTIIGTPLSDGIASFEILVGGRSCSFDIPVLNGAKVSTLDCDAALFSPSLISQSDEYKGFLRIPYTGGNGASYAPISFKQNGLTFELTSGTVMNGNCNLIFEVSGTPLRSGNMTVNISFAGRSCSVEVNVLPSITVLLPGNDKAWMRHNLGGDMNLDPDIPVQEISGNYYQWGLFEHVATASTNVGAIAGWNSTAAPIDVWLDTEKTATDPCPSGFRVPTDQQMTDMVNNTSHSTIGTFVNNPSNFGSAMVFSNGVDKMTLPANGYRISIDGQLRARGGFGHYWTSTAEPTSDPSKSLYFKIDSPTIGEGNVRSYAFSIRCIRE